MWWLSMALAAVPGQDDYVPPALDVELARPVRDGRWSVATETGRIVEGPYAGVMGTDVSRPVRWEDHRGNLSSLVSGATGAYLFGGVGVDRLQIGVTAPVWVDVRGAYWEGGVSVLGDPSVDLAVGLFASEAFAVAATGRVGVPLGGADRMVGAGGVSGELGLAGDGAAGPLRLALDARYRATPELGAHDVVQDDVAIVHAAAGVAVVDDVVVGLEWLARPSLVGSPFVSELLLTASYGPSSGWGVQAALGRGLTNAVGSPQGHGLIGLRYRR